MKCKFANSFYYLVFKIMYQTIITRNVFIQVYETEMVTTLNVK